MRNNFWKIELSVPKTAAHLFASALEPFSLAISSFEVKGSEKWQLVSYSSGMPDIVKLKAMVAVSAAVADIGEPSVICEPLPEIDWLASNKASFKPSCIGSFYICPTHYEGPVPSNKKLVWLDAATAFGSGEHESTAGCLVVMSELARSLRPRRVLDLGCGSGILSMAAAKLWYTRILAVDIDSEALRVTKTNLRKNRVNAYVTVKEGDGLFGHHNCDAGPFDLIIANILAGPLIRMAANLTKQMCRPGLAVLSGMLSHQRSAILNCYRKHGLLLVKAYQTGNWVTLLLKKPL